MAKFDKTNFRGDPNIGMYGFASDKYCIVGNNVGKKNIDKLKKMLKVKIIPSSIFNTQFLGMFCAGNSDGIVIPKVALEIGTDIQKKFKNMLVLNTKYTALGNLILLNDNGVVISSLIKKEKNIIKKFFSLDVEVMELAETSIVGNAGIATNNGCVLHPVTKDDDIKKISSVLGVEADIGTVNYGSMFVGSGTIANKNGFITGFPTSGPELGRMVETLGFL
ncbi:translation initiation factor IF-6 [Candidatus Aenigmatarchaeota archaeon]